jgi:S-adenosyl-L-methionine hydrolase (adenosine-forming)
MPEVKKTSIVTLLTDFGTEDGYVGAMKGVILQGFPSAQVIDISHDIAAFNVRQAAFSLINYAYYFPAGSIHLVVVDPGVGSSRQGLILRSPDYYFVGPDNGVFSYIYQSGSFTAWRIREDFFGQRVSPTFHGRDVFAPAVVRLLKKESPEVFCEPVEHLSSFYESYEVLDDHHYRLKVIHIDHFGNLILNFTLSEWRDLGSPSDIRIQIDHSFIYGIKKTFAEVDQGQMALTWDSRGFLQIAQNCGNASRALRMKEGDHILLTITES